MEKDDQGEFIIDLPQRPEEIGNRRDKFDVRCRAIGNSGIEINADSEDQAEEPYHEEIVDDWGESPRCESATRERKPDYKSKKGSREKFLGGGSRFGWGILFPGNVKS